MLAVVRKETEGRIIECNHPSAENCVAAAVQFVQFFNFAGAQSCLFKSAGPCPTS